MDRLWRQSVSKKALPFEKRSKKFGYFALALTQP